MVFTGTRPTPCQANPWASTREVGGGQGEKGRRKRVSEVLFHDPAILSVTNFEKWEWKQTSFCVTTDQFSVSL